MAAAADWAPLRAISQSLTTPFRIAGSRDSSSSAKGIRTGSSPSISRVRRATSAMRGTRELGRLELDQSIDVGQRRTGMDRCRQKTGAAQLFESGAWQNRELFNADREEVVEAIVRAVVNLCADLDRHDEVELGEQSEHRPAAREP